MKRTPMTLRGAERLRQELKQLKSEARPNVIKAIAEARAHGDLSENAEYHAAREQQSFIEGRINDIENRLSNSEVIDVTTLNATGRVVFGCTVELSDEESGAKVTYQLVENSAPLNAPPADADQLLQLAFQQRPDLQALNYSQQAAIKFSHAERDQMLPSITAAGTAGTVPIRPATYYLNNWWGGIGVNMNIPIFNGFLYQAQAKEASVRAQAVSEQSRDLRDRIVRDVRTAWLAANTAYQRVGVTRELLNEANLALSLAETRYRLGLSSIVELSQAQFQQTDAAIGNTDALYQYQLALSTLNYQIGATP